MILSIWIWIWNAIGLDLLNCVAKEVPTRVYGVDFYFCREKPNDWENVAHQAVAISICRGGVQTAPDTGTVTDDSSSSGTYVMSRQAGAAAPSLS